MVIPYPRIPPVIFSVGPFALRWYGLMYLAGYVVGFRIALARIRRGVGLLSERQLDGLVAYLVVGMLIGARLTYVLVYNPRVYRAHPLDMLKVWEGGLSFHGAALGMAVASALFAHRNALSFFAVTDTVAFAGTPGLFFGRIGNFINGELYGRVSNVPWAMVFPSDPRQLPRHPSQLYEAVAEGIVLFTVLWLVDRRARAGRWYRPGVLTGTFLTGYALIRILLEFTREPDVQLGFVLGPFSMGQLLSAAMMIVGVAVLVWSRSRAADFGR